MLFSILDDAGSNETDKFSDPNQNRSKSQAASAGSST